jgi:hypothetical protein
VQGNETRILDHPRLHFDPHLKLRSNLFVPFDLLKSIPQRTHNC